MVLLKFFFLMDIDIFFSVFAVITITVTTFFIIPLSRIDYMCPLTVQNAQPIQYHLLKLKKSRRFRHKNFSSTFQTRTFLQVSIGCCFLSSCLQLEFPFDLCASSGIDRAPVVACCMGAAASVALQVVREQTALTREDMLGRFLLRPLATTLQERH